MWEDFVSKQGILTILLMFINRGYWGTIFGSYFNKTW